MTISKLRGSMHTGFGGLISLGAFVSVLTTWSERLRQRRHLAGLDDHMLRDIGLNREDVAWECNKPFWWR